MIDGFKSEDLQHMKFWILSDGKIGHINQSVGVCAALGVKPEIKTLEPTKGYKFWRLLHPLWAVKRLPEGPFPDVVISAGNLTKDVAKYIKRKNPQTKIVQLFRPQGSLAEYDVVAVPRHNANRVPTSATNVVFTLGACNKITPELMEEAKGLWQPRFGKGKFLAVLVGGASRLFDFTAERAEKLAEDINAFAAQHGYKLLVTTSRRTGDKQNAILKEAFKDAAYFFDGEGENPFFGFLACADMVISTADSVNMPSEAASAGKPVLVWGIDYFSKGKMQRYYTNLFAAGYAQKFVENMDVLPKAPGQPLNDAARVAGFILSKIIPEKLK